MVLEQYIEDPVTQNKVREIFNQEIPETKVVGNDIEIPIQIFCYWNICLFLLISLYRVYLSKYEEIHYESENAASYLA